MWRRVTSDDRYCSGCGVAFGDAAARNAPMSGLQADHPGFRYHVRQGFAWGLGFMLAGVVATLVWLCFAVIAFRVR
jgi:hypothetical protein